MGKAPAVIIIARHGARLDQADKEWHLTSPTPYDPPLTYGGWTQARALGARIGTILRAREEDQEETRSNGANSSVSEHSRPRRKRKHKIIIHSSPFVRCVQTSIAIAAGIGQFKGRTSSLTKQHAIHSASPHIHALESSPGLSAIPEPAENLPSAASLPETSSLPWGPKTTRLPTTTPARSCNPINYRVAELRIDAFLGEWLSPDYFESITPPPGSVMMVASAKAELLRPAEAIEGANLGRTTHGNFPGGWSIEWSPASSADESEEKTGLANMGALGNVLGHVLPQRAPSSIKGSDSSDSLASGRQPAKLNTNINNPTTNNDVAYVPPTPTYAISPSDPIPVGYVAHARDACIDVSYQWDSMRAPQCWGTGGEYGEEWSSMHRRFRNGLAKIIEWYEEHGTAVRQTAEMTTRRTEEEKEDEETDTVLILVTHGAGCNALLGALTNQPVLLDVGMASLTMAVRKERAKSAVVIKTENGEAEKGAEERKNGVRGSIGQAIAEGYEVKYTASTEHLRAGSNALGGSAGSPRIGSSGSGFPYRRPTASFSGDGFAIGEGPATFSAGVQRPVTAGATLESGGLHRSVNGHSAFRSMYSASSAPRISSGLWRSGTGTGLSGSDEATNEACGEVDNLPNFGSASADTVAGGTGLEDKGGRNDMSRKTMDGDVASGVRIEPPPAQHHQHQSQVVANGSWGIVTPSELIKAPLHTSTRTASQRGLWGGGFAKDRDMPKRRWTVVENSAA